MWMHCEWCLLCGLLQGPPCLLPLGGAGGREETWRTVSCSRLLSVGDFLCAQRASRGSLDSVLFPCVHIVVFTVTVVNKAHPMWRWPDDSWGQCAESGHCWVGMLGLGGYSGSHQMGVPDATTGRVP